MAPVPGIPNIHCDACEHVACALWRIDCVEIVGSKVLLAKLARYCGWQLPLLDSPRVLKMFGEPTGEGGGRTSQHGGTLVCEEGWLLDAFLQQEEVTMYLVARVLLDVLAGLRSVHQQGFAHGAVDAKHIVVGVDKRGNLLAPFWCEVGKHEPDKGTLKAAAAAVAVNDDENEEKAPAPGAVVDDEKEEKEPVALSNLIAQDLLTFAQCAQSKLVVLERQLQTAAYARQLERTLEVLAGVIEHNGETDRAAVTRLTGAFEKLVARTAPPTNDSSSPAPVEVGVPSGEISAR